MRFKESLHCGDRWLDTAGRPVPHEHELTTGPQHTTDLRQGTIVGEPMKCLCAEHAVDRAVGEWNRLRGSGDQSCLGAEYGQPASHLGVRLNRDDPGVIPYEQPRQLAGSGAQLDHRLGARVIEEPNGRGWVARAAMLVVLVPPRRHPAPVLHGATACAIDQGCRAATVMR
jgi:hypothetical protein